MTQHSTDTKAPQIPWTQVMLLSVAQTISWGTVFYSFTLFLGPMERELGWTKADLSAGYTMAMVVAALSAMIAGRWIDAHGGRALMTAGSLLAACLLAAFSQVSNQLMFYGIWAAFGVVLVSTFYEPLFTVLVIALRENAARAITAVTLVAGFAGTVFVPLTNLLIDTIGWREALLVLAAFNLFVNVPIHLFALKGLHPKKPASQSEGSKSSNGRPVREAMAKPVFWALLGTFFAHAFFYSSIPIHLIPMIISMEISKDMAVAVFAIIGPSQVFGRILMAGAERLFPMRYFGFIAFGLNTAAFLILITNPPSIWTFMVFAGCFGMANGMTTIVRATVVPELLGLKGIGTIQGAITLPSTMMLAFAPYIASLLEQNAGTYDPVIRMWLTMACVSVVGYGIAVWTGPRHR